MNNQQENIDFYLIGMGNVPSFSEKIISIIQQHHVFSGGKRHYELVKSYLPKDHQWILITGDMPSLLEQYTNRPVVIFVSGDPFFYGFGNTLQRLIPKAIVKSFPYFNSIQLLCHQTQTNYNELKCISVHGRDWSALDEALIRDESLIGVLTDQSKSPIEIAKRLIQYHFIHYEMIVGEDLEGDFHTVNRYTLQECTQHTFHSLNCLILVKVGQRVKPFGLADELFIPLPNRPNMITKMAVRLNTIEALQLKEKQVFWDIGACTGSVAIEVKRHYPSTHVVTFEKREICEAIIHENCEKHATPGIEIHMGDFFDMDLSTLVLPDVVFIGGHGNRLEEMIQRLHLLNPKMRMVTNAVQETTAKVFTSTLSKLGFQISQMTLTVDHHNTIQLLAAQNHDMI